MQSTIYDWLDHEWIALRGEGRLDLGVEEQTRDLFERMDRILAGMGLTLADTMRSRLFGRDRDARDRGSRVRVEMLKGAARSASSSFIDAGYFDSSAAAAVELWAMRPAQSGSRKALVEYDPPIVPLRYLIRESVMVLSGVTSVLPTLDEQAGEILKNVEASLTLAGVDWSRVVKLGSHLHHSQSLGALRPLLQPVAKQSGADLEFAFADGYSTPGKLVEIETTASIAT